MSNVDNSSLKPDHENRRGFFNPWTDEAKKLGIDFQRYKLFKFALTKRQQIQIEEADRLKVVPFKPEAPPPRDSPKVKLTWIGHATVLVQFRGISVLTDPIWYRCGPMSIGPARIQKTPCEISELPKIDAVLISHSHFDHLDRPTVKELCRTKFGDEITWFVPKNLKSTMIDFGCSSEKVIELDWGSSKSLQDLTFTCTPCQHWSLRSPLKGSNKTLWASWAISYENEGIFFFAGDTGYCTTFTDIGNALGPFKIAAIPIGAYLPRDFLKCQHVDPTEAVKIHTDIRAQKSIGVHWGTFPLGREAFDAPKIELREATKDLTPKAFEAINIGETVTVE